MKNIKQKQIARDAEISQSMLSQIMGGKRRAGWKTAKRLSATIPGSTPEQWLEAPPETLRQIISEFALSRESNP